MRKNFDLLWDSNIKEYEIDPSWKKEPIYKDKFAFRLRGLRGTRACPRRSRPRTCPWTRPWLCFRPWLDLFPGLPSSH